MRTTVTLSELYKEQNSLDPTKEIIIDKINSDEFTDLMMFFLYNKTIKYVKIDKIIDADLFEPESSIIMLMTVEEGNKTLRRLDFGDTKFKEKVVQPFMSVLQRLDLDELNINCQNDKINEQLANLKKRNVWLLEVFAFYINNYISDCVKDTSGNITNLSYG